MDDAQNIGKHAVYLSSIMSNQPEDYTKAKVILGVMSGIDLSTG